MEDDVAVTNDEREEFRLIFTFANSVNASPPMAGKGMEGMVSESALCTRERRRRVDKDDEDVLAAIIGVCVWIGFDSEGEGAEVIDDVPESKRSRNARISSLARSDSSLLPKLFLPPTASAAAAPPETLTPKPTKLLKLFVLEIPLPPPTDANVGVAGVDGTPPTPLAPEDELLAAFDFKLGIALLPLPAAPLKSAAHPIHILSTRTSGSLSGRAEAARDVLARCKGRENVGGFGFDGDAGCCCGVRYADGDGAVAVVDDGEEDRGLAAAAAVVVEAVAVGV